jgi:hypothetical protein
MTEPGSSPPVHSPVASPPPQVVVIQQPGNGMSVAGFVCGLLAVIFGLVPILFFVSFPLAILGAVFSLIGRGRAKRDPARSGKGLGTAGLILSVIGFALAIVGILILGAIADYFGDEVDRLEEFEAP